MKTLKLMGLLVLFFGMCGGALAERIRTDRSQPMGPVSKASELFYKAAKNHNLEMMDTYLARGADINCGNCDNSAKTPLAMALTDIYSDASTATVAYLVEHGADVNLLTQGKMSPLMFSLMGGARKDMKTNSVFLVANGADVRLKNKEGNNALIMLSTKGYGPYDAKDVLQMMQFLVEKGTNVNHQNKAGRSALMYAAEGCGIPSVQLLLSLNANPALKSVTGETALSIAEDAAANSRAGSNCNQMVAMLRNPEQYKSNPLSNSDVVGLLDDGRPSVPTRSPDNAGEAVQGLFNGLGKLLGN